MTAPIHSTTSNVALAEGEYFSMNKTSDDKLIIEDQDIQQHLKEENVVTLKKVIADGVKVHHIITNFQDFLLMTFHLDPLSMLQSNNVTQQLDTKKMKNDKHPTSLALSTGLAKPILE